MYIEVEFALQVVGSELAKAARRACESCVGGNRYIETWANFAKRRFIGGCGGGDLLGFIPDDSIRPPNAIEPREECQEGEYGGRDQELILVKFR